ncbi:mycofactocin biosynthesis chaperone MftB [Streptomyces sp. NBC_01235]|uniref:mycofactocin biosynthesis chaperone MftB n=1 Tax=Streptomyces sp. NBC_01235 TaxID=2903788 RepID=UPI002E116F38|nr:mycofactocin biosynthesis chaperone MftB [Streptomyces sp. NBC_01235]WSP86146.1 mycofactocin biosynthesis chaperone MftB [Streptomyces sp. NBC_01235]
MACAASTDPATVTAPRATEAGFDLDAAWDLHPQVAVRPERFGALLYHFGTRRLSFLKDPRLLAAVQSLADQPSAGAACRAAGVQPAELARFGGALAALAASRMITARPLPRGEEPRAEEAR